MISASTLRGLAAYLQREAARRAEGKHPGVVRLRDDEIAALAALIRRENGETEARP